MDWDWAALAHKAEVASATIAFWTFIFTAFDALSKWNEYRDAMLEKHALDMYVKLKKIKINSPNIFDGSQMAPSQYWGYEGLFMATCESLYMSFKDKGKKGELHPWVVTVDYLLAERQLDIERYLDRNPAWTAEFDREFVEFMRKKFEATRARSLQKATVA